MIDINPFCDSDIRNGLLFLLGVNLIMIGISVLVDGLAVAELFEFSDTWNPSSFYIPEYAGHILLVCDIMINLLQMLSGWTLYTSVSKKVYGKIHKLFYPTLLLYTVELGIIITYVVCIPSSPYYYYCSLFTFLYKGYLLWPIKRFIDDHSHHHPRFHYVNERTRLLATVG